MKRFCIILLCFYRTFASAQVPLHMPEATVYDRLNQPTATSQLINPYGPTVIVTYASGWAYGAMDLMDEMDSLYKKQEGYSKIRLVGLNIDNSISYYTFFTEANSHKWQNFYILHDSKGTYTKAAKSRNAYQVFFLNEKGDVFYCVETCDFDAQDVYDYCQAILRGEAKTDTIYLNEHWFPCEKQKAKYYRPLPEDSSGLFIVKDYHMNGELQMNARYSSVYPRWRSGILEYYNAEGNLSSRGYYKDNVKYGTWITWYESGTIQLQTNYFNGKKQGPETYYFENGHIQNQCDYYDNIPNGISTAYYFNGQIADSILWRNGMKQQGTEWYENGKIKYHFQSHSQLGYGIADSYYENGARINIFLLNSDSTISIIKQFSDSGTIKGIKKKVSDSTWFYTEYYAGEKTKFTFTLNNEDALNGVFTEWYESGNKKHEVTFVNGVPSGIGTSYYENGILKERIDYSTGNKEYFSRKGKKEKRSVIDDLEFYRSAYNQRLILLQTSDFYLSLLPDYYQ